MKIYSKIVWNWDETELVEIESDSYEYSGPIALLDLGGGGGPSIPAPKPSGGANWGHFLGGIDDILGTNFFAGVSHEDITAPLSQLLPDSPDIPIYAVPDHEEELEPTDYSNLISNDAPIQIVYGKRMIGGHIVHVEVSEENKYLHVWYVLCEGEIETIEDVIINGVYYRQDGTRLAVTNPSDEDATQDDYVKYYTLQNQSGDAVWALIADSSARFGTDDQAYTTTNTSGTTQWTSDHKGSGLVVVPMRFEWNKEAWSRIPKVKFVVEGKKVYDPRDQSTSYSTNPVLHLLDYLRNTRYGCGIPDSELDFTSGTNDTTGSFSVGANLCDADITLYGSTSGDRWTGNSVINPAKSLIHNVKKLLGAFGGHLIWEQGVYALVMETTGSTTVFDFTEDHIIGGVGLQGEAKRSKFNRVFANFINSEANYERDEVYWPDSDTYLDADNGTPLETTLNLGCITDAYRATNMCKRMLLRSRTQKVITFLSTSEAYNVTAGDLISVTHESLGFSSSSLFRVSKMVMNIDGTIQIVAKEHNDAIYTENTNSAFVASSLSNLPNALSTTAPTGLTVSEELFSVISSAGVHNRITISWTASTNLFTEEYEWQYKKNAEASTAYRLGGFTSTTSGFVDDLDPLYWNFRVRAINSSGAKSAWATVSHFVVGLTDNPEDVENFSCVPLDGNAYLTWSAPSDVDVRVGGHIKIRWNPVNDGSATWEESSDISDSLPSWATSTSVPLSSGTYMAKWIDSEGMESVNAVSAITTAPDIRGINVIASHACHPDWSGTFTNNYLTNVNGALEFGRNRMWDDFSSLYDSPGNIDDWTSMIDHHGDLYSSGEYLTSSMDLGKVRVGRVNFQHNMTFSQGEGVFDLIDSWTGSIDTCTDFDTGSFSVVNSKVMFDIRTTHDDPSGSPTWSDWQQFRVADYSARGLQWRIRYDATTDSNRQIEINELTFYVDVPDQIKSDQGTWTGTSDTQSVLFSTTKPFHSDCDPHIGMTVNNLETGEYFQISGVDEDGFTLAVKESDGSRVNSSRTFNYLAKGY